MAFFKALLKPFRKSEENRAEQKARKEQKRVNRRVIYHPNDMYMIRKTIAANSIVLFGRDHNRSNIETATGYRHDVGFNAAVIDISTGEVLAAAGAPMPVRVRFVEDEPARGFDSESQVLIRLMGVTQRMVFEMEKRKPEEPPKELSEEECPSYWFAA